MRKPTTVVAVLAASTLAISGCSGAVTKTLRCGGGSATDFLVGRPPARNFVVAGGQACFFKGIAKSIEVRPGGVLILYDATVLTDVTAHRPGYIAMRGGNSVGGNVTIDGAEGNPDALAGGYASDANYICDTHVGGDLVVTNSSPNAPWNIGDGPRERPGEDDQCDPVRNSFNPLGVSNDVRIASNGARIDLANSDVGNTLLVLDNSAGVFLDQLLANSAICLGNERAARHDADPAANVYGQDLHCPP